MLVRSIVRRATTWSSVPRVMVTPAVVAPLAATCSTRMIGGDSCAAVSLSSSSRQPIRTLAVASSSSSTPAASAASSASLSKSKKKKARDAAPQAVTYRDVLQELLQINRGPDYWSASYARWADRKVKLGIENTADLARHLGTNLGAYPTIHVAGTNGKGSVCLKLARALRSYGLRVGLYTSPHISSFRERIMVDDEAISEAQVVALGSPILAACRNTGIPATFFELTTLMAFAHFERQLVDVAIIEVGLGGRGDSTNIISPRLSIITSIGLEHTAILGDTVEKIAWEKGGIIKPGVPAIIGRTVPRAVVTKIADEVKAPLIFEHDRHTGDDYDLQNQELVRVALTVLEKDAGIHRRRIPSKEEIDSALATRPACRMEEVKVPVTRHDGKVVTLRCILDVAHNPQAFASLYTTLRQRYGKPIIRTVIGLSQEKDAATILRSVFQHSKFVHLVAADSHRAKPILEISRLVRSQHLLKGTPCRIDVIGGGVVGETTQHALEQVANGDEADDTVIVFCGSFFIMRDVRAALGIVEPRDPMDLNESFGAGGDAKEKVKPTAAAPPQHN